jgi:thiamine-phosphate pyrophosphorylase
MLEPVLAEALPETVMVQLRARSLPDRSRVELGRSLRALTRRHGQLLSLNERADLALLLEADALHLGEHSVCAADARLIVGALFISRACHDPADAEARGADALLLSPIFAPRKGNAPLGLGALGVARRAGEPNGRPLLYALGGVDAAGARQCLEHGADGVAAIGAIFDGENALLLLDALGIRAR